MPMQSQIHTNCCHRFHPEKWDGKAVIWDGKPFIRSGVKCFFRIPRGLGRAVAKNTELLRVAGAQNEQSMVLSDRRSMWSMELFTAVDKDVPGADNISLSGTYITKVFEGPFKNTGRWSKEMTAYVKSKNKEPKRLLFWHTTCPKCAKAYGKNYVVLFAEVEGRAKEDGAAEAANGTASGTEAKEAMEGKNSGAGQAT